MLILAVQVYENGFVMYCDENNGTWTSWEDVWCATFGNRRGGRPSSRGGARVVSPYPLSISQSHIQIYILTLHLLPQHSSSSDVRTSRATLRLVRFFSCAISSSTCRDPIPNVSFRSQASYSTLVHLLTPYMQFN